MSMAISEQLPEVLYQIKLTKSTATFLWGSKPLLKSSIDLRVRIDPKELVSLAKKFKAKLEKNMVLVPDFDVYNRLLIYACVRPALKRDIEGIRNLREQIENMTSLDALYWASAFRELWWKHGEYSKLRKVIRAFRLFFEI